MENPQLNQYIKSQLEIGVTKEQIVSTLSAKGWPIENIQGSFNLLSNSHDQINIPPSPVEIEQTIVESSQTLDTQVQATTQTLVDTIEIKPKPKKSIKKIAIICTALFLSFGLLLGGGIFAYITYFPSPEIVLARAFQNAINTKTVQYSLDLSVEANTKDDSSTAFNGSYDLSVNGSYDRIDPNNQKSNSEAKLKLLLNNQPAINGTLTINGTLESRTIGNDLYFNVIDGPAQIDNIKNQWIKYVLTDNETVKAVQDEAKTSTEKKITTDQKKKLDNQLSKIAKISKVYSDDKIDNMDTYHYQYQVNQLELAKYTELYQEIYKDKPALNDNEKEDLIKQSKDLPSVTGEIWIGKKDFNLYRMNLNYDLTKDSSDYKVKLDLKLKNYGQQVQVNMPEKSKTFEEVFKSSFPQNSSIDYNDIDQDSSNKIIVNGTGDDDKDGLTNSEESFYGTDPKNPDTDGDGYNDAAEVKAGYDPNGPGKLETILGPTDICGKSACGITTSLEPIKY